MKKIIKNL